MKNLVSIIVNCYNGEKYLSQTLNSILNQSYKKWECVFWDNQSTDNSKKIFDLFRKKDKRFIYYKSKTHISLNEARNLAINKCRGEYICFLDCDDLYKKNKLRHQIQSLKPPDICCCFCNFDILSDKNKIQAYNLKANLIFETNSLAKSSIFPGYLSLLIKRKYLNTIKNPFFRGGLFYGDFVLIHELNKIGKIIYINKNLCIYRKHDNSSTAKYALTKIPIERQKLEKTYQNEKIFLYKLKYLSYRALAGLSTLPLIKGCYNLISAFWFILHKLCQTK